MNILSRPRKMRLSYHDIRQLPTGVVVGDRLDIYEHFFGGDSFMPGEKIGHADVLSVEHGPGEHEVSCVVEINIARFEPITDRSPLYPWQKVVWDGMLMLDEIHEERTILSFFYRGTFNDEQERRDGVSAMVADYLLVEFLS